MDSVGKRSDLSGGRDSGIDAAP